MLLSPERSNQALISSMELAVLSTLAYSDVFDYPLRAEEIHRYLPCPATLQEVTTTLSKASTLRTQADGYHFLSGRGCIVKTRHRREQLSRPIRRRAVQIGRLLGQLPFVRMVALTGSLALSNAESAGDMDFMLVTDRGRLWTARASALLLGRLLTASRRRVCPNIIVAEDSLEWMQRDLYTAREICQMVPLVGSTVYAALRNANTWTETFLPNALGVPPGKEDKPPLRGGSRLMEWALRGSFADRLEAWEMRRKVRRLTAQAGFGEETRFGPALCWGNFDHHGARTRAAYQQRLDMLGLADLPVH